MWSFLIFSFEFFEIVVTGWGVKTSFTLITFGWKRVGVFGTIIRYTRRLFNGAQTRERKIVFQLHNYTEKNCYLMIKLFDFHIYIYNSL